MERKNKRKQLISLLYNTSWKLWPAGIIFLLTMLCNASAFAQNGHNVKGTVLDEKQEPVIGATVILKADNTIGTITDVNGVFTLSIPGGNQVLVISFVGMDPQEIAVEGNDNITVVCSLHFLSLARKYGSRVVALKDGKIVTSGGRVLNIVAHGENLAATIDKVYQECAKVQFKDMYYRKDIGKRNLPQQ